MKYPQGAVLAALLIIPAAAIALPDRSPAVRADGTYAILNGADTAVLERWTRSDDSLQVTMDVIGQVRLEFDATLAGDATMSTMAMRIFPPGQAEPAEEAHAEFRGDSVIAVQRIETGMDTVRRGTRPGAVPYLWPSVSLASETSLRFGRKRRLLLLLA